jgi:hypothetical protein
MKKGRREEVVLDPLLAWIFLRRRVNPRAASGGGMWRRRATMFLQPQRAAQHFFEFFWGLFCKFQIVQCTVCLVFEFL